MPRRHCNRERILDLWSLIVCFTSCHVMTLVKLDNMGIRDKDNENDEDEEVLVTWDELVVVVVPMGSSSSSSL